MLTYRWWDPRNMVANAARGLGINFRSAGSTYAAPKDIIIRCLEAPTADRYVTLILGNVDRTLDFTSNPALNLAIIGGFLTLNLKGGTNLKLPLSGTLQNSNIVSVAVAGSNITLSDVQNDAALLILTGTPGATRTITLANAQKLLLVWNNTDATQTIAAAGGGSTVSILAGAKTEVYADGATNVATFSPAYVEGTWTPVLADNSNNAFTMTQQVGLYTRVGDLVFASFSITWTGLGSAGASQLRMTGLPFACKNVSGNVAGVGFGEFSGLDTVGGVNVITCQAFANLTRLVFRTSSDNAASASLLANSCSASGSVAGSVVYKAA